MDMYFQVKNGVTSNKSIITIFDCYKNFAYEQHYLVCT